MDKVNSVRKPPESHLRALLLWERLKVLSQI